MHNTVPFWEHFEAVQGVRKGLSGVAREHVLDFVLWQSNEMGQVFLQVDTHVSVGTIPDRQIWDFEESSEYGAYHVGGSAGDGGHQVV